MEKVIKEWRKHSHLAYLQETEFKEGEFVYWDGGNRRHRIEEVLTDSEQIILDDVIGRLPFNVISHFYPHQKIDPSEVSYVREVRGKQTGTASATGMGYEMTSKTEWQPAPEPSEDDYQSAVGVKFEVSYEQLKKDRDKWLTDLSEGKVQAVRRVIDQEK